uniref:Uncharacterized protein n=1 Tax=Timema douglasi TaxID=61478 RepID=A0A7R8VBW7_TIMDO|nr:unnamed protein product [Timema douglasi]
MDVIFPHLAALCKIENVASDWSYPYLESKKNGNLTSVYEFIHMFFFHKFATLGTVSLLCAEAKKQDKYH